MTILGRYSRPPVGLSDLLQLRSNGQLPSEMIAELQPTVDMMSWLLNSTPIESALANIPAGILVASTFNDFGFFVPAGEIWLLRGFSVWGTVAAAETLQFRAACAVPNAASTMPGGWAVLLANATLTSVSGTTAPGINSLDLGGAGIIPLMAGAQVRFGAVTGSVGVTGQLEGYLSFHRLRRT